MPQKTCSTMTSLHHSPSTAKGMYPSKAGNWTSKQAASKNMQRACLDKLCPKVEETETRDQDGPQLNYNIQDPLFPVIVSLIRQQ